MYQPECYSSREEIVSLVKMLAPFSRPLTCHIRGEGNHLLSSVREVIEIAKEAEVPLNISHFKATGKNNWGITIGRAIDLIEDARTQGQDVTVDAYPYSGGSTTLLSLLPPVMMEETVEQTLQVLSTKVGRERLCREIYNEHDRWDNMVTAIGWERILISSVTKGENLKYSGKTFSAAAELAGYDECALFLCDLLLEEDGKVGIIVLSMSQQDVDRVLKLPYSMVISDALYGVSDSPHPRLYGSFSKVLHEYVNERKILCLEEAIHKMTCLPAQRDST